MHVQKSGSIIIRTLITGTSKYRGYYEALHITLQAQAQGDKFNNKNNHYSNYAFLLMLQGMLYEKNDDENNAFISCCDAAEIYLKSPDRSYYGTPRLLRTALQPVI